MLGEWCCVVYLCIYGLSWDKIQGKIVGPWHRRGGGHGKDSMNMNGYEIFMVSE